jgi:hypothetical protein
MARRALHCLTSFKAMLAHGETEIRQTGEAAAEALGVVKRGLDRYRVVDVKREPFRRLVR